ncbi:MAG: hypothetical protein ACAH80_07430 [Alphaproteobacteria bacterium]
MKTFMKQAAQGDMLFRKVDALPIDAIPVAAEEGNFIVGHSETGHHHVVKERPGVRFYQHANDNFIAWLVVDNTESLIEHLRDYDTHEPIMLQPGIYEIRRQREYILGLARPARD